MRATQGSNHVYYNALDGLRAICIILTLINHTPNNPHINGSVGVDIFFALSGYLITMLLMRERAKNGRVCLICFYIRRIFRIVPLYALTIALYFAATYAAYRVTGDGKGLHDFFAALPWLATFTSELRPESAGTLFGHAWTLGIEEKYYLAWPLLFSLFVRNMRVAMLIIVSVALGVLLLDQQNVRGYIGILFGSMLALSVERNGALKPFIERTPAHIWVALMMLGYIAATRLGLKFNLLVSIPAAFLISALINQASNVYKRALSHPFLVYVGGLTYGIYLIHPLVQHIVERALDRLHIASFASSFIALYVGSILIAIVLQKLVEAPLISFGRKYASSYADRRERRALTPAISGHAPDPVP